MIEQRAYPRKVGYTPPMASLLQFSERFGHMLSRVFLTLLYLGFGLFLFEWLLRFTRFWGIV